MREKEIKVSVQKGLKIVYATVSLIILIIALWIIFDCFKKTPDQTNMVVSYNSTSTADYKVYLKSNNFYDRSYIDKGKKYIANIISYVDLDLNYRFNISKPSTTAYTYNIDAIISSEYESNGATAELWSKKFQLTAPKTLTLTSSNGFNVNEKLNIDYQKYDSLATKFKEEYGIASDTKLTIVTTISSNSSVEGYEKPISETKKIQVSMPLNKPVTEVNVAGIDPVTQNITEVIKGERNINYVLLVGAIIATVLSAPVCIASFYKLFKITNVSQYIVQQNKILKSYGDVIAEVTDKPDLYGLKIVEVKKFDDLINIEDELRVPILFYDFVERSESWFIITTNTQAYRYILKSTSDLPNIYGSKSKKGQE